jgi:MFS family permease
MVDRHNRKLMMMVSDLAAGLATLTVFVLLASGHLEVWHFYVINIVIGLGNAFQWPAYSAAITTMVPKEQYGRANGMVSFVQAGPNILAPIMAGALLPVIGLKGILLIDILTFVLAIGALLIVHVPPPNRTQDGIEAKGNILKEAAFGFKYIFIRPSLLNYVIMLFAANLFLGMANSIGVPMILSRTGNDSVALGAVETAGAISWTVGAIIMSIWGGPKRKMIGAIFGWVGFCIFGTILFGLGRNLSIWIPALLIAGIGSNIGIAASQAILQIKVAPDVQGRVFSARRLLTWFPDAFTPVLSGLLADYIMEPQMKGNGVLSRTFGWMVGHDAGSGMAVISVVFGVLTIIVSLAGYMNPQIRNLEDILPDHDQIPVKDENPALQEA